MRVYLGEGVAPPAEVPAPRSPRKYWTRRGIAEWLVDRLTEEAATLVGIDHGFSLPLRYFETYGLKADWPAFLDDFCRHWPTGDDNVYVDFVRDGFCGNGAARMGNPRWRLTERRVGAKSIFHFGPCGLPWLRFIRERLDRHVHFWPFDGWACPAGRSVIVEVYPSLWSRDVAGQDRTPSQRVAFAIAVSLSRADRRAGWPHGSSPTSCRRSAPRRRGKAGCWEWPARRG